MFWHTLASFVGEQRWAAVKAVLYGRSTCFKQKQSQDPLLTYDSEEQRLHCSFRVQLQGVRGARGGRGARGTGRGGGGGRGARGEEGEGGEGHGERRGRGARGTGRGGGGGRGARGEEGEGGVGGIAVAGRPYFAEHSVACDVWPVPRGQRGLLVERQTSMRWGASTDTPAHVRSPQPLSGSSSSSSSPARGT